MTTKVSETPQTPKPKKEILNFNPAIDSLKIRIPLDEVKILHPSLGKDLVLLAIDPETGDQVDEKDWKHNALQEHSEFTSCYYSIGAIGGKGNKNGPKFLILGIHAKHTGVKNYFEGITPETIKKAYSYVQKQGVVSFSYESFSNARVTDWDIKQDMIFPKFQAKIDDIVKLTKYSRLGEKGYRIFNGTKQNPSCGIQWSVRESTKYSTNPFLKIYHKAIELQSEHPKFYDGICSLLSSNERDQFKDLVRIEVTVKNKNHFRSLGFDMDNTLWNIVNLSRNQLSFILAEISSKHFEKKKALGTLKAKGQTPTDRIWMRQIHLLIQKGVSYDEIKFYLLVEETDKTTRYRMTKKLDEIYQRIIAEDRQTELQNIDLESMYKLTKILGIN